MNILLYATLVILFLIGSYYLFIFKEEFEMDTIDERLEHHCIKYNQMLEFTPEHEHYDFSKDSRVILDYKYKSGDIDLNNIEYKNLKDKIAKLNIIEYDTIPKIDMRLPNYAGLKKEVELAELNNILLTIFNEINIINLPKFEGKTELSPDIKQTKINRYSYNLLKEWLIEIISIGSEKYSIDLVNNDRYRYIGDSVLSYKIDTKNKIEEFIFQMRIYRPDKKHNFIVYFEILYNYSRIAYYFKNILILGMDLDENVLFHDYKKNKHYMLDKNNVHLSMVNEITDGYLKSYKKNVADFLSNKHLDSIKYKKRIYDYDRHMCFGKEADNKADCISPSRGDPSVGIWDEPCIKNEDCPFYKKNLNYPNNRGGCIKGYCEMPQNVTRIGYKFHEESDNDKVLCHNCRGNNVENTDNSSNTNCKGMECKMCCKEQESNFKKYPGLITPDYAFDNDFDERIKHSASFIEKNLKPVKFNY